MTNIVDFLRAPADSPSSWSTGFGALDDVAQFHPGRIWVVTGVGAAQLLCQWAYDLAVTSGLEVSFIGSAAQPESAYRHWFGRNVPRTVIRWASHRSAQRSWRWCGATRITSLMRGSSETATRRVRSWPRQPDAVAPLPTGFALSYAQVDSSSWQCLAAVASSGIRRSVTRSSRAEPGHLSQTSSSSCAPATMTSST